MYFVLDEAPCDDRRCSPSSSAVCSLNICSQECTTSSNDGSGNNPEDELGLDASLDKYSSVCVLSHRPHIDTSTSGQTSQGQYPEDQTQWVGHRHLKFRGLVLEVEVDEYGHRHDGHVDGKSKP